MFGGLGLGFGFGLGLLLVLELVLGVNYFRESFSVLLRAQHYSVLTVWHCNHSLFYAAYMYLVYFSESRQLDTSSDTM